MSQPRMSHKRDRLMGVGSFCVGGEGRSEGDGARDFQVRFNETFETRFRFDPKDGVLVAKAIVHSTSRLRLAHLRCSSHTMSLLPGRSAATCKEQFLVTFQTEGTSIVRQDDREARADLGSLFVLDASRPFQVETSVVALQLVYLPSDVLREALPGIDHCTAVVLPTREGAGRIARVAFEELFDPASEADEERLSSIASMLPHTLAAAFGPHLKRRLSSSRDDHHRERVKDFVRRNLRNPRLTASFIASGVGLSVRRLHELFVSEPETLMRWTRAERLKRINDELADPALVERPIANIAYDWGFREPSHFSRTFRTEYGASPRVVRERNRFAPQESSRIPSAGRGWMVRRRAKAGETLTCGNLAMHQPAAQRCE